MTGNPLDPKRFTDRLFGVTMTILGAALALYVAVRLLESIVGILVSAAAIGLCAYVAWIVYQRRQSDW